MLKVTLPHSDKKLVCLAQMRIGWFTYINAIMVDTLYLESLKKKFNYFFIFLNLKENVI